mgnify:CR=1 FL=1
MQVLFEDSPEDSWVKVLKWVDGPGAHSEVFLDQHARILGADGMQGILEPFGVRGVRAARQQVLERHDLEPAALHTLGTPYDGRNN